jgi:hypothetical protein
MDSPTLLSDVFDLIEASIQQGRAIERVDKPAAAKAYRAQLAALGRVLQWVGEDDVTPAELLITAQREPGA